MAKPVTDPKKRFFSKMRQAPDGCLIYGGFIDRDGYGQFNSGKNVTVKAHRYAYELSVGPIPNAHDIDHTCWNRACCNPDHLRALPLAENRRKQRSALASHCKHGHPFDEQNTYIRPSGSRDCRKCNGIRVARYQRKKAAA